MQPQLRSAIAHAMAAEVVDARPVAGGDVARSYRVGLADGRVVFAKTHLDPPPDRRSPARLIGSVR